MRGRRCKTKKRRKTVRFQAKSKSKHKTRSYQSVSNSSKTTVTCAGSGAKDASRPRHWEHIVLRYLNRLKGLCGVWRTPVPKTQQHPTPGNRNNATNHFKETHSDRRKERINKESNHGPSRPITPTIPKSQNSNLQTLLPHSKSYSNRGLFTKTNDKQHAYEIVQSALDYGIASGVLRERHGSYHYTAVSRKVCKERFRGGRLKRLIKPPIMLSLKKSLSRTRSSPLPFPDLGGTPPPSKEKQDPIPAQPKRPISRTKKKVRRKRTVDRYQAEDAVELAKLFFSTNARKNTTPRRSKRMTFRKRLRFRSKKNIRRTLKRKIQRCPKRRIMLQNPYQKGKSMSTLAKSLSVKKQAATKQKSTSHNGTKSLSKDKLRSSKSPNPVEKPKQVPYPLLKHLKQPTNKKDYKRHIKESQSKSDEEVCQKVKKKFNKVRSRSVPIKNKSKSAKGTSRATELKLSTNRQISPCCSCMTNSSLGSSTNMSSSTCSFCCKSSCAHSNVSDNISDDDTLYSRSLGKIGKQFLN